MEGGHGWLTFYPSVRAGVFLKWSGVFFVSMMQLFAVLLYLLLWVP